MFGCDDGAEVAVRLGAVLEEVEGASVDVVAAGVVVVVIGRVVVVIGAVVAVVALEPEP
ncbi:MAG TPA: hypothetical protein VGP90_04565 [Acidimicrobiia bacterium]|nr:hypothetical protein [Acidimicrobiia bacterium]